MSKKKSSEPKSVIMQEIAQNKDFQGLSNNDKKKVLASEIAVRGEKLRVAELDVRRTYEAGRQLFENACDYLRVKIMPVHKDHELLKEHTSILGMWVDLFDTWNKGIGVGNSVDWEKIDDDFKKIKRATEQVFKREQEFKDGKLEPIKQEIMDLNTALINVESKK
jgi:hypothetical protein